jgi:hypothetical protein
LLDEAKKWKRLSLAFGLVVAGVAAYIFPKELEHHEPYIPPEYPFIDRKVKVRVRNSSLVEEITCFAGTSLSLG